MALKRVTYTRPETANNRRRLCVGGCGACVEAHPVRESETSSSTDLGGSSEYISENLMGRSEEGFLVKRIATRVSRS